MAEAATVAAVAMVAMVAAAATVAATVASSAAAAAKEEASVLTTLQTRAGREQQEGARERARITEPEAMQGVGGSEREKSSARHNDSRLDRDDEYMTKMEQSESKWKD